MLAAGDLRLFATSILTSERFFTKISVLGGTSVLFARKRSGESKSFLRVCVDPDLIGSSPNGHERDERICRLLTSAELSFLKPDLCLLPFLTR